MFSKRQAPHVVNHNTSDAVKIRSMMTVFAWVCLITGVVLSLIGIGNYSDQNHVLMIGIGFLIASVHIYVIGLFMALMFTLSSENNIAK